MNAQFQMFGIHVYLQDPNKLTCIPVTSNKNEIVTSPNIKRPHRTQRTGVEYEKTSKSESYEIDVIEYTNSASNQHEARRHLSSIVMVILNFIILFKTE